MELKRKDVIRKVNKYINHFGYSTLNAVYAVAMDMGVTGKEVFDALGKV